MCKELVSAELYDNARKAFKIFESLKETTGLEWSLLKACPDPNGHTIYTIYGVFEDNEIERARNALNAEMIV